MNGGTCTSESRTNELWVKLCCLCRSSILKDLRKRKRLHGTRCTKAKAILARLTTVSLQAFLEDVSAIVALVIRAYKTVLNDIKG